MSTSTILKSPLSSSPSSYGVYGTVNINPYASYFGPHHTQSTSTATTTTQSTSGVGGGMGTSSFAHPSGFMSPIGTGMSSGKGFGGGGGGGGGSPSYIPPTPGQTRIIGGISNSGSGGSQQTTTTTSPNRMTSSSGVFGSQGGGGQGQSSPQQSEPMHYSPIGSGSGGSSPSTFSSPPYNPNTVYLPAYFLGLDQYHHHYQGMSISPPSPLGGGLGPGGLSPLTISKGYRKTVLFEQKQEVDLTEDIRKEKEKKRGPPIHGFGNSQEALNAKDFLNMVESGENPSRILGEEGGYPGSGPGYSSSPSSSSPSSCWVTVFGFPQSANSFIVLHFSTLGKIMEVKCTPGSNWLHLHFSNSIEARRALAKNGKVLGQSIMVGVKPSDVKIVEAAEKASMSRQEQQLGVSMSSNLASPTSPSPTSPGPSMTSTPTSSMNIKSRLRPLAAGGSLSMTATSPPNVLLPGRSIPGARVPVIAREHLEVQHRDDRHVPKPATGILTKAMEFMFGW